MGLYTKQTNIDEFPDWTIEEFDAIEEEHEFSSKFRRKERAVLRKHNKNMARRFALTAAAAAIAVVILPIGVYAAMNHRQFFRNVFGDVALESYDAHDIEVDTGKGYSITTTIPGKEYVPVDEESAEELIGRYTLEEPITIQVKDHTVTILSAVRDKNALVMEFTVECPTGVTMFEYSDDSNERKGAWLSETRMETFSMEGMDKIYVDLKDSTPERLHCYSYGTFMYPKKDGQSLEMNFDYDDKVYSEHDLLDETDAPECFTQELSLSAAVPSAFFTSNSGATLEISPLSCRFDLQDAFEGVPKPENREECTFPYSLCDMKNIDINYKDGTSYTVLSETENVENVGYVCGVFKGKGRMEDGYDAVYVFNRLVDVNAIESININGNVYIRD
ncbi:MAG: hypothetical protein E7278_09545 [Lachnospiraceae bacterium]|jgi:hypothetical protein|nr:hypothetical protein [Lachnospiraceae bacterium]